MNHLAKSIIKISLCAVVAGGLISLIAFAKGARTTVTISRDGLEAVENVTTERQIADMDLKPFHNLDIDLNYCDLEIREGDRFSLEAAVHENDAKGYQFRYEIKDDTLTITNRIPNMNYRMNLLSFDVDFNDHTDRVILTVPKGTSFSNLGLTLYSGDSILRGVKGESLTLDVDYGSLTLENCGADSVGLDLYQVDTKLNDFSSYDLDIKTNYGSLTLNNPAAQQYDALFVDHYSTDITLSGILARELTLSGNYGSVDLDHIVSTETDIEAYQVEITADSFAAGTVRLKTNYGSLTATGWTSDAITGGLYSHDLTLTGSIRGITHLDTDYGAIRFHTDTPRSRYYLKIDSEYGDIIIGDNNYSGSMSEGSADSADQFILEAYSTEIQLDFGA